jgi:pectinesterase
MKRYLTIAIALMISTQVSMAQNKAVTIGLIGDSTVAEQSGWGPAFASRLNGQAKVLNHAVNGATLESLSKKLDALLALKPDYVLIQFGHNDQKRYGTDVYSTRLKSYIERIQKAGAKPIVISSVTRRTFDKNGKIVQTVVESEKYSFKGDLAAYAKAAQGVATEMKVPFIDLFTISIAHHNAIGPEASMTYNFQEGDKTHFNKKGTEAIASLIIPELVKVVPELAPYLHK